MVVLAKPHPNVLYGADISSSGSTAYNTGHFIHFMLARELIKGFPRFFPN